MQKLSKFVMIGAALLTFAGCSSSTPQSSAVSSVQTESVLSSTSTTNSVTNNSTTNSNTKSQDLASQADQWRTAFEKEGFTITDWDLEYNEISFDASQGQNLIEVEIQKPANPEYAFQEDQDRYDFDTQEVSRYQNANDELVVLRDVEDKEYEIVAIDRTQGIIYSISEVQEEQLQTILNLLGTLNLPIN